MYTLNQSLDIKVKWGNTYSLNVTSNILMIDLLEILSSIKIESINIETKPTNLTGNL